MEEGDVVVCPTCNKVLTHEHPVWYRSPLTAWLSFSLSLLVCIVVASRAYEHLSSTVTNLNDAKTYDEIKIEKLDATLKAHHENSSLHLSERDAADFQGMKRTINEISAEQGQIHRMLAEIDRKLRYR